MRFTRDEQTRMQVCVQQQPLQVVRAFPLADGATLVHLHNLSGGVLGGDQLAIQIDVGEQAEVQLTTTSATRIYRSLPQAAPAHQLIEVQVQAGGVVEYLPDPLIPFAGSRYQQQTRITLAKGAGLFWWETIAPGRAARGERFAYDLLQMHLDITALDRSIALERFTLRPQLHPPSSFARLGPYQHLSSFYICKVGLSAARWTALEQELNTLAATISIPNELQWGVSTLTAHGLVVRAVSTQGRFINTGLRQFWQVAKQALYGRDALLPRKVY